MSAGKALPFSLKDDVIEEELHENGYVFTKFDNVKGVGLLEK